MCASSFETPRPCLHARGRRNRTSRNSVERGAVLHCARMRRHLSASLLAFALAMSFAGVQLSIAAVIVALYLIFFMDPELDAGPVFLLNNIADAAVVALIGAAISILPP